jgi:hypothetical protein
MMAGGQGGGAIAGDAVVTGEGEMRSLALTPTWSVATVLTLLVAGSLLIERSIHRLSNVSAYLSASHDYLLMMRGTPSVHLFLSFRQQMQFFLVQKSGQELGNGGSTLLSALNGLLYDSSVNFFKGNSGENFSPTYSNGDNSIAATRT